LARDIDLGRGLDDLGKEELGQIVASSIEALLDNSASGMDREQMTTVLAERSPPPASGTDPGVVRTAASESQAAIVDLGAFYSVQAFAPGVAVSQGPGAFGSVGIPSRTSRLSARWSAQYVLPQQLEGPLVGVRLDTIALRLGAGYERDLGEGIRVGLWLGGGIDLAHIDPRQGETQVARLTDPRYTETTLVTVIAEVSARMSKDVRFVGALVADSDLHPRHYDLATPTGTSTVLEPWRVHPGVVVGIATWH